MTAATRRFLPLSSVRLLDGPDAAAQRTVRDTLLRLDVDRLLAPFRREAGLPASAPGYPGWEAEGLDGHTAGHVLSALSALAAQGDDDAREAATALVDGMRACQLAIGTGYLGGVPDGVALWDELAAGRIDAGAFHLNGRWVPLYNLHKTLAGLLDAALVALPQADVAVEAFGQWWLQTLAGIDDDALAGILRTEFGGVPDALARLAVHLGDRRLLELARRFVPEVLVAPLAAGRDELDGLHANTQIPVVVGFAAIERAAAVVAPDLLPDISAREGAAARTFFDAVAYARSSPLGGDSVREHFPARDDFLAMFTAREGPESCNTFNMVKLAGDLHLLAGDDAYLQWAEHARANHLRSTQHPDHGGLVYFTSHRPGHYRVYAPEAEGFWCCMGSGFEAQASHAAHVFADGGDRLEVNAFVAAEATWGGATVSVRPAAIGAAAGVDEWTIDADADVRLSVLVPDWVEGVATVTAATVHEGAPGTRVAFELAAGERATISLPRALRLVPTADGSAWGSVVDGPDVLALREPDDAVAYRGGAARMGHIAVGPLRPLAATPILAPDAVARAERLGRGQVRIATDHGVIALEPFAGIHDARYTLVWPTTGGDVEQRRAELAAVDAASLALDARTRDVVRFGEQQPESDHRLTATDEQIGVEGPARWRRTTGAIALTVTDWSGSADRLLLRAIEGDDEAVRVRVRDRVVHEAPIDPGGSTIAIGPADGTVEFGVVLEAVRERTPRLVELRLLAADSDR
ncbi:beta-L-arabinofuranosidase domain-containing protein [Microbacterium sp. bgisy189]|uniref:beta-L-arabinofuranosidase domain-containing protein n=1 Tax=Microbacterium sp. bgisy189 TaxID=3413798 RepID=UPI003EBA3C3F